MSLFVTSGAVLSCSFGTTTCRLKVPKSHGSLLGNKNQATIIDSIGMVNIPPFQMCKRTLPNAMLPCTPTTCMKWINGKEDFIIGGDPALLTTCVIPCIFGGMIKIDEND